MTERRWIEIDCLHSDEPGAVVRRNGSRFVLRQGEVIGPFAITPTLARRPRRRLTLTHILTGKMVAQGYSAASLRKLAEGLLDWWPSHCWVNPKKDAKGAGYFVRGWLARGRA